MTKIYDMHLAQPACCKIVQREVKEKGCYPPYERWFNQELLYIGKEWTKLYLTLSLVNTLFQI